MWASSPARCRISKPPRGFSAQDLSYVVAAVLGGSVISTLFAGMLADWMGRKKLMFASGLLFVASIPMIAMSHGFGWLFVGRLLQGCSAGLVGVVVPLYLAECLDASNRGKGTAIFQWLLTLGIVIAAVIGFCFSLRVEEIEKLNDVQTAVCVQGRRLAQHLLGFAAAGRLVLPFEPLGGRIAAMAFSPWPQAGRAGRVAPLANPAAGRNRTGGNGGNHRRRDGQQRRPRGRSRNRSCTANTSFPFFLACIILACNQLTGINSIISYNATILIQAGLSDKAAHFGYVILTVVNFVMTMVAVMLVDRKGRKFLLSVGSGGIIVSLLGVAALFHQTESQRVDCREAVQALVADEKLAITFNSEQADKLLAGAGEAGKAISGRPSTMIVIYSYGDFVGATTAVRSDDKKPDIEVTREDCVPENKVTAMFDQSVGQSRGGEDGSAED